MSKSSVVSLGSSCQTGFENRSCGRRRSAVCRILKELVEAAKLVPGERVQIDRRAIVNEGFSTTWRKVLNSSRVSIRNEEMCHVGFIVSLVVATFYVEVVSLFLEARVPIHRRADCECAVFSNFLSEMSNGA